MNTYGKMAIVVALALAVGAALWARQHRSSPSSDTVPGAQAASNTESTKPDRIPATKPSAPALEAPDSAAISGAPQQQKRLPRLVDLGAGKCIPCKMMAPILDELKAEYEGRMDVVFIDVWENPDAGKEYGIRSIPTQIFYDAAGRERFRHVGFFPKEDILKKCRELGFALDRDREAE